ncbi:MAG: transglutaminase, partial [Nitrospirae bacterium]|nr:transglutaminase [Nitrospirota bacterium]
MTIFFFRRAERRAALRRSRAAYIMLRIHIIVIVVISFLWTFGGLFDIAYAIESQQNPASKKQQVTQQSAAPKQERPEEKFEKGIEEIIRHFDNIQKVQTDKERDDEKNKLKTKTQEINTLDADIRKQFADTEKKLKEAKLPAEILQRHYTFVKSYEDNLNELNRNIAALDKAKTKAEIDAEILKAKPFFEKITPPKRHQPLDPNNLPHKTPELKEYPITEKKAEKPLLLKEAQNSERQPIQVATTGSLSGLLAGATSGPNITRQTPPAASDLAETMEVQLTPEIRAKAQELENKPVKIYEWVRNTIEYEPYYGSLKGAQQTLDELAGNDLDQASLLLALLRAANIPARYVYGTIELPIDRLMNWIGVKDSMTAARILATNGIPGTLLTEGGQVKYAQFEHAWVEAYVDMFPSMGAMQRQASYWTPLDPSMKETESSDSLNVSKTVPFDETIYLNSGDDMPPVLSYIYKLKDYYNTNYDYNFMKIFHVSVKKKEEFGILLGTLPYEVISEQRNSEMPDTKRHKIRLGLTNDGIDTVSVTKAYPEITGKKVTLTYTPATTNDQAVIDRYGGLLHTPAYLISVRPEIKLDNTVVLTGPAMGLGSSLTLKTELTSPNMSPQRRDADITQGLSYAIGLPALHYSGLQLVSQIDRMRALEGTLYDSLNAMDIRAGELLHNIAIEYFGQLNNATRSIEGVMHVQNTKMPSIALISADATYTEVFGIPISPPIMKGLGIDAIRVASSPMPIDGDLNQRREFIKHRGLTSSYLEHKILENLLG